MSRKERFTPQEKEQACIDYIEGNRSNQKYVVNFIFLQEHSRLVTIYKNMVLQDLQRKLSVLIQNNLRFNC